MFLKRWQPSSPSNKKKNRTKHGLKFDYTKLNCVQKRLIGLECYDFTNFRCERLKRADDVLLARRSNSR